MDKKVFWYSVIASVVASIAFSWLLEPISRGLWNLASDSASSWLMNLQNAAFMNAALGKRDWAIVSIFFVFSALAWGVAFGAIIGTYLARKHKEDPNGPIGRFRRSPWRRRIGAMALALWVTLGLYQWTHMCFMFYVDLQLNASFSQRLDALGPYIDQIDEKKLKSAWALMKTRDDYEKINSWIDGFAKRAGVDLPSPLYR